MIKKNIFYLFIFTIFIGCETDRNISVQYAHDRLGEKDVLFLDVRTRQEFVTEGRIKNARLIPLNYLEKKIVELEDFKKNDIIVYCRSGQRSKIATDLLIKNDFSAFNMEGGFLAWKEYTHP